MVVSWVCPEDDLDWVVVVPLAVFRSELDGGDSLSGAADGPQAAMNNTNPEFQCALGAHTLAYSALKFWIGYCHGFAFFAFRHDTFAHIAGSAFVEGEGKHRDVCSKVTKKLRLFHSGLRLF